MSRRKTVFITGASSGIGQAFAKAYAKKGFKLFLTARRENLLRETIELINEQQKDKVAHYFAGDLTNSEQIQKCIASALEFLRTVDLVICNAGVGDKVTVEKFSTNRIKKLYEINVFGVLRVIEGFLPTLIKQKHGHIVTTSSLAAYISSPQIHPYNATKAAIKNHMEGMAKELRPYGISVTCLCPGFVKTAITANLKKPLPFLMGLDDAVKKMIKAIEAKKEVYAFPWQLYYAIKLIPFIPKFIRNRVRN